jgi:hypothetical protein
VLFQELGHDLVLALQFILKSSDSSFLVLLRRRASLLKRCGPVLEELFLPVVEHRWLDAVLVAKIRDRNTLNEMTPKDGDFLDGRVMLAWLAHGRPPVRVIS